MKTFWRRIVTGGHTAFPLHHRPWYIVISLACVCVLKLWNVPRQLIADSSPSQELSLFRPDEETTWRDICYPRRHVMFLKTHKCGSSTVQNILLRFVYNNNLTLALPEELNYIGDPGSKFRADLLPPKLVPLGGKVDVFALHTRLNVKENLKILHRDALWITVVRDPVYVFESLYMYFNLREIYGMEISDFKRMPISFLKKLPRASDQLGRNQMLFDLGYPEDMPETQLRRAVEEIDRLFDLVLVAERMDESLVLLRHELCWSLRDVVVFTKNARRKAARRPLDADTRRTLRELNGADARLYDHFLAKHRRAVLAFGVRRMAREVSALRSLRDQFFKECDVYEVRGDDPYFQFREYSGLVSSYVTTEIANRTCLLLCLPETPLVDLLRERQLLANGHSTPPALLLGPRGAPKNKQYTELL
ncbi:galactosylceramide sulfotransferase-like [Penaeus japonicus]|uniref:galactosylceramide sulfotransferase-like n=1 Tax=Penaeus japonicus TaxID=27405 RepID=UPI001C7174D9|nr:galactosylceramide sulfotransferase-like [Penaeus japonicus]